MDWGAAAIPVTVKKRDIVTVASTIGCPVSATGALLNPVSADEFSETQKILTAFKDRIVPEELYRQSLQSPPWMPLPKLSATTRSKKAFSIMRA